MSDEISATVSTSDLRPAIESLISDMRKRVVRAALRDAAKPMLTAARGSAPVLSSRKRGRMAGTLRRGIRLFSSKVKNGNDGVIGVYIGVKGNKKALRSYKGAAALNPNDPYYWFWQEFGFTATGRRKLHGGSARRNLVRNALIKTGQARRIPGKGFMRSAFSQTQDQALRIFERRLVERVEVANRNR